ncbi:MAG TPA: type II toxin-antitoxin system prevent-host-death family antitoxin [Candidatus Acidoferrales bacterium]|nr:type II toxin-antitoxin system prevent-host-death family antitoxin [Candidatus Acidoferrales bacterium]
MKKVGSREFKNRQGHYLRRVRQGETIVVTDRGEPVARVEPVANIGRGLRLEEKLRELAAEGHLRLGTKPFIRFRPAQTQGKPASQMILEDRD